jgi:molecular chaperone DnaK
MDIVAPNKMNKDDIQKKMDEWGKYEDEDKKTRQNIETRNSSESLVYTTDKTLQEYKDKIPQDVYDKINNVKSDLEKAMKDEDYNAMKEKSDELAKTLQEIGQSMYKQGGGDQQPQSGPEGGNDSNESAGTTDADFKVEK